jgi:uncharacterized membrane protein YozB (DUF420 family)
MGILGTSAPVRSDITLIIQVVILAVLGFSITKAKRKEHTIHAYLMLGSLTATLWNALIVMVPKARSLVRLYRPYGLSILIRIHMTFGVIVLVLGIYILGVWRLEEPGPCFKQKRKMRILSVLWLLGILGGFVIYYMLYI